MIPKTVFLDKKRWYLIPQGKPCKTGDLWFSGSFNDPAVKFCFAAYVDGLSGCLSGVNQNIFYSPAPDSPAQAFKIRLKP